MKNAIAIRHVAFEDLGSLAPILLQQDYAITYLEAGFDSLAEINPLAPELLIILGGPIGAYEEQDYPFLLDELRLLDQRLATDLPTLGICLGSQLIARVLGTKVYPGMCKEIGWAPIQLSEAGQQSLLSHLVIENTSVMHWHGDTFNLPQGATHLASSSLYCNQAFSYGKHCLALQFHPEVTATGLERWFIGHACEIATTPELSLNKLRVDTARNINLLEVQAARFWHNWLGSLQSDETSKK